MRPPRSLFALLLAFTVFVTACGDDAGTSDAAPVDTDEPQLDSQRDESGPEDEVPEGEAPEDDEPEPEIGLTDSYRGVTAETVTIGLAMVDIGLVNDMFGLDLTVTPVEEMHLAWAEALNEAGGINGRSVEIVYRGMQPVGPEDSDRICLELMEDEEVFVVLGQFLQDAMLCITETYGHPYVGHFGETPERQEKSDGLLFAAEIAQVDQRGSGTQAMIDAGDFDARKVAVVWESDADRVYWEIVEPILAAADVDVVASLEVNGFTTDTISNESAWDIAMEQIQVAEADVILNLSGITGVLNAAQRTGALQTIAHTNGQAADGPTVLEEAIAEEAVLANSFAITAWKPDIEESLADPEVQRCIAEFAAAYPEIEIDREDADWVNSLTNNCRAFALTVRILEAAGGDLTPESFRAAGESLGRIDLPAMSDAFLGPDAHSAGSTLSRYEYEPAEDGDGGQYVKVGEPIVTG